LIVKPINLILLMTSEFYCSMLTKYIMYTLKARQGTMKSKKLGLYLLLILFSQAVFSQDLSSYIKSAQQYYDHDNYVRAYPLYQKIVTELKYNDGIILYKYYYCYRVLYGMDARCQLLLQNAYDMLLLQYPNHKYLTYAFNRLHSAFASNNHIESNTTTAENTLSTPSSIIGYNIHPVAENGDLYGYDNDGDGRTETVYVKGYYRKDGTYVRSHYRASPKKH
jgi:hypothetical protein